LILTVSANGLCLDVGALVVPEIFVLVHALRFRAPRLRENLRRGELVRARFVTGTELVRNQKVNPLPAVVAW
jgi:hypothetical protein